MDIVNRWGSVSLFFLSFGLSNAPLTFSYHTMYRTHPLTSHCDDVHVYAFNRFRLKGLKLILLDTWQVRTRSLQRRYFGTGKSPCWFSGVNHILYLQAGIIPVRWLAFVASLDSCTPSLLVSEAPDESDRRPTSWTARRMATNSLIYLSTGTGSVFHPDNSLEIRLLCDFKDSELFKSC